MTLEVPTVATVVSRRTAHRGLAGKSPKEEGTGGVGGDPAMKTGFLAIELHGGQRPDIVATDIGSYSDVVFGLLQLLGPLPPGADPSRKVWSSSSRP